MPSALGPEISVLLPFRDAAASLPECLASISAQTWRDFEILCVDDGSTDGGASAIACQAEREPRIRLLRSPGHGLVAALNFGLHQARAPLIARMDADDLMHPRRLALQRTAMLADAGLTVLGSRVTAFPEAR
jgi:glycosyltransferase involved in cell wall biosynthesis